MTAGKRAPTCGGRGAGGKHVDVGALRLTRSVTAGAEGHVRVWYAVTGPPGACFVHAVHALLDVGTGARLAAVAVAAAQEIATLKVAVDRRTVIGKGLGILMARYDLSDDQAFAVLRRASQERNRKLYDLAEEVIRTRRVPSE